jgi:NADPH-dependent ferric siderophore reductase
MELRRFVASTNARANDKHARHLVCALMLTRLGSLAQVSHNVTCFVFSLDRKDRLLGLPTGKHMLIRKARTTPEGEEEMVMRAYTPTTANETRGRFELVVKIYYAGVHPRFPEGGKFSQARAAATPS